MRGLGSYRFCKVRLEKVSKQEMSEWWCDRGHFSVTEDPALEVKIFAFYIFKLIYFFHFWWPRLRPTALLSAGSVSFLYCVRRGLGSGGLFILSEAECDFSAGWEAAAFNSLFHSHGLVGSFMGSCAVRMNIMLKPQSALLCFFVFLCFYIPLHTDTFSHSHTLQLIYPPLNWHDLVFHTGRFCGLIKWAAVKFVAHEELKHKLYSPLP